MVQVVRSKLMGRSPWFAMSVGALAALAGACGKGGSEGGSGGSGPGGGATTSASSATTSSATTSSTTTASSSSSGAGAGSSSSSASSSSSTSSGSGSCTLPPETGKPYFASVELGHIALSTGMVEYSALGDFATAPAKAPPTCAGTQMGICCYTTPGTTTPPTPETAGTLTITDGATKIATLASPYVATNATVATLTWTPGSTLKVATSGATVDAFDLSVVTPALLAGLTPAFGTATITVTTSADLVVSWTPSNEPCSTVEVSVGQSPATLPYIGCVANDSAGTLTVPHELLSKFTATTGTATIERVEGAGTTVTNASVRLVVIEGHVANVKFQP